MTSPIPFVPPAVSVPLPARLSEGLGNALGVGRFFDVYERLPRGLKDDGAMLQRLANLIDPVDLAGTRGSYAGWITRHALSAAAHRADERALASLLIFFQRGGSIRELEAKAARLLPVSPLGDPETSFVGALWARINPLWGWRRHRKEMLQASGDPLRLLKMKELEDRGLRLAAGDAGPALGSRQQAAYLRDDDVNFLAERIAQESPGWLWEATARRRHDEVISSLSQFLAHPREPSERLWPPQVRGALRVLSDDRSASASRRIQNEYSLFLLEGALFEKRVRERRQKEGRAHYTDPATQNAVYFPKNEHGGAALYVRSRPIDIPWNSSPAGVFFEVLATVIHEDDHHARMSWRSYSGHAEEKFAFELHGHGIEFLWRAQNGDPSYLRSMTVENPLGFGLAFRDYFEKNYL